MRMKSKVALVTGAGSGIGRAAALALAREGGAIAVVDADEARVKGVVQEVEAAGGRALGLTVDISDADAIARAARDTVTELGGLDVVIANAGVNGVWAAIDELAPEEWD